MSIWGTFGAVEPLYKVGFRWNPDDVEPGSFIGFAESGWYGGSALRVTLENGEEGQAAAVASRQQVEEIVRHLQDWLARTAPG